MTHQAHQFIVMDIETMPRADAASFISVKAPKTYKDQEKIDAYVKEKTEEEIKFAALSAETCQVAAVGWTANGSDFTTVESLTDEAHVIASFWNYLRELSFQGTGYTIVTFNGSRFDIPVLIRRSWCLGIEPVKLFSGRYFDSGKTCDIMEVYQCGDRQASISLGRLSKLLGVGEKVGSGADYAKLLETDPEKAKEYHINDLFLTWHCGIKMGVITP